VHLLLIITEITKNGYTRSSNNHFRVQRKSSTRTPPGRPLIGRTTVVPGSGSKQSGCTRCAELMFRSTRYWLPLYPDLVRSVQATRRRAHTPTRARVHTRISEWTHDQPPGYGSPPHVKYSDILEHTTNPQDTDLRVHTRHDELLYVVVDNQIPHTYGQPIVVGHRDGCFRFSGVQASTCASPWASYSRPCFSLAKDRNRRLKQTNLLRQHPRRRRSLDDDNTIVYSCRLNLTVLSQKYSKTLYFDEDTPKILYFDVWTTIEL